MDVRAANATPELEALIAALSAALTDQGLEVQRQPRCQIRARNTSAAGIDPMGKALNPGLSQTVTFGTNDADGRVWWWWLWSGPTRDAPLEAELLCPADDVKTAARRISRVLALRESDPNDAS
jgi:hypothetical protein